MVRGEKYYREILEKSGWRVERNGWPDFLCFKGNNRVVLEIKETGVASTVQLKRLRWFASIGIRAYLVFQHTAFKIAADGSRTRADVEKIFGFQLSKKERKRQPESPQTFEILRALNAGIRQKILAKKYKLSRQRINQIARKHNIFRYNLT